MPSISGDARTSTNISSDRRPLYLARILRPKYQRACGADAVLCSIESVALKIVITALGIICVTRGTREELRRKVWGVSALLLIANPVLPGGRIVNGSISGVDY